MEIEVYVFWCIGYMFTLSVFWCNRSEYDNWADILFIASILLFVWPFYLGYFYSKRKV